jgi:predicted ATPase/DNA-binding winged helix-turn-helix (wHTH) protein
VLRRVGANPSRMLAFGPFRLFPDRGLLLEGDAPVRIGSRALDILTALVERAGEVVSKADLIECAWPNTIVVEANLRVHVAGLRKLLGDGQGGTYYIAGVVGRGYRFVAPVVLHSEAERPTASMPVPGQSVDLPVRLTRMVGRGDIVAKLSARLSQSRFITIVGTGGIGKTSVALAVAEKMATSYRDGARFVDLTPVANPLAVPSALSSALGTSRATKDTVPNLIAFLRDRHMLLVLDNCEHVIRVAAALAEQILRAAPHVNILATSREPLDADGEVIQRLAPLALPPRGSKLTSSAALAFPSVQLFVDRVSANVDGFQMTDEDASAISEICGTLDGLPLAIELAAGRVDAFGVRGLAALLSDRFKLLMPGRRTGPPRHQTLGTMLDWSYDQLAARERTVLGRLAVFASRFNLESASVVVSAPELAASDVIDQLASLVTKSLVVAEVGNASALYRLLSTTRAYALQKLTESGESDHFFRQHAEHCCHLVEWAEAQRVHRSSREWLIAYGDLINDVRSALDWAFSPTGEKALGVTLTIASVPLWIHLSLNEECRARVEVALSSLDLVEGKGAYDRLRLFVALAGAAKYAPDIVLERTAFWKKALEIAESPGNTDYQLRSLWGLWADTMEGGENRAALALAERFARIATASDDIADSFVADRMLGYSLYTLGEHARARFHVERMLNGYTAPANQLHIVRYQFDQRVTARIPLAAILWLQGFPEQAVGVVNANIDEAKESDHEISLAHALAQSACLIALYVGDLEAAERFVATLLNHPWRHAAEPWHRWSRCFRGVLMIKRGDLTNGVQVLSAALAELPERAFHMRYIYFLGELAEGLGRAGEISTGTATIDQAIDARRRSEENWCAAELLRIKGEILLKEGGAEATRAGEECFHEALDLARRQNALSWELRVATGLAQLWRDQGRTSDARVLLSSTYGRFTEGFSTTDLKAAKTLLGELI